MLSTMNLCMNLIVYHIASGQSLFSGVLLILLAVAVSTSQQPHRKRYAPLIYFVGLILVVTSSTAIPMLIAGAVLLATLTWLTSLRWKSPGRIINVLTIASWFAVVACELPHHVVPAPQPVDRHAITVIGDSVTAGTGSDDFSNRWPQLLAERHKLRVQDISQVGGRTDTALKRVRDQGIDSTLVIVEIGGNDLLGPTTVQEFRNNLDSLLAEIAAPGRQVLMFELPLPPFFHQWGHAQRELAEKHHVMLIPKRVFLSVIAEDGATMDSIHLTQLGHKRMEKAIWRIISPAFDSSRKEEASSGAP